MDDKMTRIGVFYDGNYFFHVKNYYQYHHERKAILSISGLHQFIKQKVAEEEQTDARFCQIVDSHFFRGRKQNPSPEDLKHERIFDDVLSRIGVTTHYLPLKNKGGVEYEKGIDVWLALEAFEQSYYKRYNVVVLLAGDGDYLPLLRKLNALGIRVMLLSWDFEYSDKKTGESRYTSTAQALLDEATYPFAMTEIIDSRTAKKDALINNLFLEKKHNSTTTNSYTDLPKIEQEKEVRGLSTLQKQRDIEEPVFPLQEGEQEGYILFIKYDFGYGFIQHPDYPDNLYFKRQNLTEGLALENLSKGEKVYFFVEENKDGKFIATNITN